MELPKDTPVRGGVYPYAGIRRHDFLVISVDSLNAGGTVQVAEISEQTPPVDLRALLAVQLGADDPLSGSWVLCWRLNYASAGRFDVAGGHGRVSAQTLDKVINAIRAAIEP